MSSASSSSKTRILTFYVIAWLMVLSVGAVGLMMLRQWGWLRIEAEHTRTVFAKTREAFDQGDVIQAQKTLVSMLEAHPDRLAHALTVFDTDALGMPAVAAAISHSPERVHLSAMEKLRQTLVFEGIDAVLEELDALPADEEKQDRAIALWHARLLLLDGRFGDSRSQFDGYWDGYSDERQQAINQLTPRDSELKQHGASAAEQLFALGLWDEAAEVAKDAMAVGAADPGLGFYIANMAERDQGSEEAIGQYERVLEALPNHEFALRRIQTLSQAG